jgi:hypothetical protein
MLDLSKLPVHVQEQVVFIVKRGSYAYGTENENSDKDYIIVYIPNYKHFLGLDSTQNIKNYHIQIDNNDFQIYNHNQYVRDLIKGIPNVLETLMVRQKDILYLNPVFFKHIYCRELYLTSLCYEKYHGHAIANLYKIKENIYPASQQVTTNQYPYGYNLKYAAHGIRLFETCIEILDDPLTATTYRYNNWYLKKILNGDISKKVVIHTLEKLEWALDLAYRKSSILSEPPVEHINKEIIETNMQSCMLNKPLYSNSYWTKEGIKTNE